MRNVPLEFCIIQAFFELDRPVKSSSPPSTLIVRAVAVLNIKRSDVDNVASFAIVSEAGIFTSENATALVNANVPFVSVTSIPPPR